MSRCRIIAPALLLPLVLLAFGGCVEEPKTAVMLFIDYSDVGPVDQLIVQAYPEDRFDDIGYQEVPETAGAPLTGNSVSVLLVLPERWAERNMIISVVGMYNGEGVGQGTTIRSFPAGEVSELELQLEEGAPECGNGILDALEQCDGSAFRGNTCQNTMGLLSGSVRCTSECLLDVSGCFECGNSAIEAPEECDSDDFGGNTCADFGFDGGALRCDGQSCTVLTDECIGGCGNNLAESGEVCDGSDFGGQTCETVAGLGEGQLGCTSLCQLDISGCHQCGNGAQEADEACDGVAFGGLGCADFGFASGVLTCDGSCQIDTSSCCGDGVRGPGEVCDGTDFGLRTCMSETGHTSGSLACNSVCELDRSGCYSCGNGAIEGPEVCDGQEFGGVTCETLFGVQGPLSCSADCTTLYTAGCLGCGNGAVDPGEACDGADLNGETCFSQGYIPSGGSLSCNAVCTAYDYSTCLGGRIDSTSQLQIAVNEAYATGVHQEIAIPENPFTIDSAVSLDACLGPCGAQPVGVTIRPLAGLNVCITTSGGFPAFDVLSGSNVFRDLCFSETVAALYFQSDPFAGGNQVIRNRFDNTSTTPGVLIDVRSPGNEILANQFHNQFAMQRGTAAISVLAPENTVAMNVVVGPFDWAILMNFTAVGPSFVDHNSVRITEGLGGGGIFLNNTGQYCYRNNIIYGDGSSTGLFVGGTTTFADMTECIGERAAGNVNINHQTACADVGCAAYCAGTDPVVDVCDLTVNPGWTDPADADLCLSPGALVDGAVSTGMPYDYNDATVPPDYLGSAPDVGAREAGTTRSYGGSASFCP